MYYHYLLLTTITTISSVTAVAIPANQNQLHTPSFATVPIKIPTGAPNAIPRPHYELNGNPEQQQQQQPGSGHIPHAPGVTPPPRVEPFRKGPAQGYQDGNIEHVRRSTVGDVDIDNVGKDYPNKPLPPFHGPHGIPLGHGPVVHPGHEQSGQEPKPLSRRGYWPSPSGIPLGHGPVVVSSHEPKPTSTVVQEGYLPSPSGIPLGHGPVIVSSHEPTPTTSASPAPAATGAPRDDDEHQEQDEQEQDEQDDEAENDQDEAQPEA